jgi:RNA 3'-terminal phosphate cyclase
MLRSFILDSRTTTTPTTFNTATTCLYTTCRYQCLDRKINEVLTRLGFYPRGGGVLFANAKRFMGALTFRFFFISGQIMAKVEGVEWKALDRRFYQSVNTRGVG